MPIQISPSQWWRGRWRVLEESEDRFWCCAMHCQHWKLRTASLLHMWTPVRKRDADPYRNMPPSGNLTFSKISLESSYREWRVFHAENVQTRFAFTLNSCDKILVKRRRPKLLLLNNFVICQAANTDHFGRFKWKPNRLVDGVWILQKKYCTRPSDMFIFIFITSTWSFRLPMNGDWLNTLERKEPSADALTSLPTKPVLLAFLHWC